MMDKKPSIEKKSGKILKLFKLNRTTLSIIIPTKTKKDARKMRGSIKGKYLGLPTQRIVSSSSLMLSKAGKTFWSNLEGISILFFVQSYANLPVKQRLPFTKRQSWGKKCKKGLKNSMLQKPFINSKDTFIQKRKRFIQFLSENRLLCVTLCHQITNPSFIS